MNVIHTAFLSAGQGWINTKFGLMLLPKKPIFFLVFKTDQEVQYPSLAMKANK